ncbi:leucine--tRNA ligase [Candidatus Azambacteria bacterium]|nr:leucine--tRNA ligase [Candidatus Azambacteria bacterium]
MARYDHNTIEKRWRNAWAKNKKLYAAPDTGKKPRAYVLDMFPYPSGEGLHVGHTVGETATDIYSRFLRMNGYNVLHPMGWDAFGLPAENYAIKHKVHPAKVVKKNVANFRKQMDAIGFSYDWSREINTTDPGYYKWTQWIFLQMFKRGLAYEAEAPINFCPSCKTGLANEEVVDGKCERCGTQVIRKKIRQWILKITQYAERLLHDVDALDWPERIKAMQRNWIGKSEGAQVDFKLHHERQTHTVFAIVNEKGEVLIEKRKSGRFEGKWLFPAGKIEEDDSNMVRAALREIGEETSLRQEDLEYRGFLGHFHSRPGEKENMLLLVFGLKNGKASRVQPKTAAELRWQSVRALPEDHGDEVFAEMFARVKNHVSTGHIFSSLISVFTTRADTLFGATYVVLAPEHPLLEGNTLGIENVQEVREYVQQAKNKSEIERTSEAREKTGVRLKGVQAVNPATKEKLPMFVADYVLGGYGTGAIMAVPAHDQRDFEFAQKFGLPVKMVVCPNYPEPICPILEKAYEGAGHLVGSGTFDGMESEKAKTAITKSVGGTTTVKYKLRDWIFSRQRYWGEPIPLVKCPRCGVVPVPEKDLPVKLPTVASYEPTGTGESPLAAIEKWVRTKCPKCKGPAKRETNTMPQWAGSCWYYLRYLDPKNKKKLADAKKEKQWMPVGMYVGGAEHAVLHLLYARFWHKFLYDIGVVSTKEPFQKLLNQGLILGPDGQKMSKSRGNVINPDDIVSAYGADVLRMYEMFMGPFEDNKAWDIKSIIGIRRFVERAYRIISKPASLKKENSEFERLLHKTIKKVTEDIEQFHFNTAISAMMVLLNEMEKQNQLSVASRESFVKLLAPFAPFLAEELWRPLGNKKSVHGEAWPKHDPKLIAEEEFDLVIQVNGRVRDVVKAHKGISEQNARMAALQSEKVKKFTEGKEIKKAIFVKDRLINVIVI